MPRGDGTGPMGMGAMTGRGAGYCTGAVSRGYGGFGFGRGQRRGGRWSAGWGMGPWYGRGIQRLGVPARTAWAPVVAGPDAEKQWLQQQAAALQADLEIVKQRLSAMDGAGSAMDQ